MTEGVNTSLINSEEVTCGEVSDPVVMNKHPLVSVKMCTYNHEPYIAQAIEGVLMQETDFPIELVIGEDCSTDRTREIVLGYQRKHPDVIRVVLWDKNVGGWRNSRELDGLLRGKYVALNEGDDYWTHPRKLQMQVDVMEANPEVGLVHGGVDQYDVVRKRRYVWEPKPSGYDDGDILHKYMYGKYHIFTPTVCIRRDLHTAVRRDNPDTFHDRFLMGDLQLWWELSRVTRFRLINEPLATYNILPESASRFRDIRKLIRFRRSAIELRMHFIRKYNLGSALEIYSRRRFATHSLEDAYVAGDRGLADSAWGELKRTHASIGLRQFVLFCGARCVFARLAIGIVRSMKRLLCRT